MPRARKSRYDDDYRRLLGLLAQAREDAGVTQVELAKAMGTSQSILSKLERGVVRFDVTDLLDYLDGIGQHPVKFMQRYIDEIGWPKRRRRSRH